MDYCVYEYTYLQAEGEGGRRGKGGLEDEIQVFFLEMERKNNLTLAHKLKPIRATILLEEEFFAIGELSCLASFAFR